jgi:hypothetical protein
MYYLVKSKRTVPTDKGVDKVIAENYLVDKCIFFAEAEVKMLEEYNNENEVVAMKQSKIREFVNNRIKDEQDIYIAIIEDIFVEDDGSEKRIKYEVGVFAESVSEATRIVLDYMKQGIQDFELVKVYKTNIVDII